MPRAGGLIRAEEAPLVEWRAGVRTRLHRTSSASPDGLCVVEQWSDPGAGAPTHRHANAEELVLVATPYGPEWYPYLMRRLAERPANIVFVARNLVRS